MPSGRLEVLLVGASELPSADIIGKSDPYAIVSCSSQSFQSTTAKGQGSKPLWNQKFFFDVEDGDITDIFVKIYDKDDIVGSDDFIGTAKVPSAKVFEEGMQPPTSYDVILPSQKVKGQVKLSMKFTPKS